MFLHWNTSAPQVHLQKYADTVYSAAEPREFPEKPQRKSRTTNDNDTPGASNNDTDFQEESDPEPSAPHPEPSAPLSREPSFSADNVYPGVYSAGISSDAAKVELPTLKNEVTAQNDEVTTQNDEVTAQNDEVTTQNDEVIEHNEGTEQIAPVTAQNDQVTVEGDELVKERKNPSTETLEKTLENVSLNANSE